MADEKKTTRKKVDEPVEETPVAEEAAKRPVRDSEPVEGVRGNREVPPTEKTGPDAPAEAPETAPKATDPEETT